MTVQRLNDAPVLDQLDEQWCKLFTALLWKLAPEGVNLTIEDFEAFSKFAKTNVLLSHGAKDAVAFKFVTLAEAQVIADHQKTMRGHA